jgi:hypothetical protein
MANSAITKPKRLIVSSIEDGPTEYDREKCHAHLIEQYKLYVEMVDRRSGRRVLVNNSFITLPAPPRSRWHGADLHAPGMAQPYYAARFGA